MITDVILICRVPQFVHAVSEGLRRHNLDVRIHPVADRHQVPECRLALSGAVDLIV